jgi:hypothetical protein
VRKIKQDFIITQQSTKINIFLHFPKKIPKSVVKIIRAFFVSLGAFFVSLLPQIGAFFVSLWGIFCLTLPPESLNPSILQSPLLS